MRKPGLVYYYESTPAFKGTDTFTIRMLYTNHSFMTKTYNVQVE